MGKNQTHSAGAARSTKFPWGASDLDGHRQGVRGDIPHPPLAPIKAPPWRPPCLRKRAAGRLSGLWDKNSSEANTDSQRNMRRGQERSGKSLDRVEFVNRVFGGIATGHDSTGRLPHQDGEEQYQCNSADHLLQRRRLCDLHQHRSRSYPCLHQLPGSCPVPPQADPPPPQRMAAAICLRFARPRSDLLLHRPRSLCSPAPSPSRYSPERAKNHVPRSKDRSSPLSTSRTRRCSTEISRPATPGRKNVFRLWRR